eukprot:Rmarinus@m.5349
MYPGHRTPRTAGGGTGQLYPGHRNTNQPLTVANRHCEQEWVDYCHYLHRDRLRRIHHRRRPMPGQVDNSSPRLYPHIRQNLKRWQLEADRAAEIGLENRHLLAKMSQIMEKTSALKSVSHEICPGVRITTNQYPVIDHVNRAKPKSLNREYRQRQFDRIYMENQALLKRIQSRTTCYPKRAQLKSRAQNEAYIKNICYFPYAPATPRSARSVSESASYAHEHLFSTSGAAGKFDVEASDSIPKWYEGPFVPRPPNTAPSAVQSKMSLGLSESSRSYTSDAYLAPVGPRSARPGGVRARGNRGSRGRVVHSARQPRSTTHRSQDSMGEPDAGGQAVQSSSDAQGQTPLGIDAQSSVGVNASEDPNLGLSSEAVPPPEGAATESVAPNTTSSPSQPPSQPHPRMSDDNVAPGSEKALQDESLRESSPKPPATSDADVPDSAPLAATSSLDAAATSEETTTNPATIGEPSDTGKETNLADDAAYAPNGTDPNSTDPDPDHDAAVGVEGTVEGGEAAIGAAEGTVEGGEPAIGAAEG